LEFRLTPRRLALAAAAILIGCLYFADLSGMGLVSKDEPRYADIARAMAHTGDWILPRLWGAPWFEKPPLLYWLSAIGFSARLGPEAAPRLPVAVLSVAFLVFFWARLRRIWNERVATFATGMLATSVGWLAYSHVAVTDLPLSALFTVTVLFWIEGATGCAAVALGCAVLAKSLVPLVLFVSVLAVDLPARKQWLRAKPFLIFLAVALPWHIAASIRGGYEWFRVLFLEQQFGRYFTPERQHVQPWWYYAPVLLLLLFPWFPLIPLALRSRKDRGAKILLAVCGFGFVFFSASLNKLPGYILPLVPALCVLMALGLDRLPEAARLPALAALLLGALPLAAAVVPPALATRLGAVALPWNQLTPWLVAAAIISVVLIFIPRTFVFPSAFALAAAGFLWFQFAVFPAIDQLASARPVWLKTHPECALESDRGLAFGLNYYAERALPPCGILNPARTPLDSR
jgi:4-amino-4-deoxy-L-arabinose transferase-like glycosyltransferase